MTRPTVSLPTRQPAPGTGLALWSSWWPSPPRWSAVGTRRPCPPRAHSLGNWRSLTDSNGRSREALTCGMSAATGPDDGNGRAFQARDCGATSGPHSTGGSRTTADSGGRPMPQVNSFPRSELQVVRSAGFSLARRKPGVQIPSPPPPNSPGHRPSGSEGTPGCWSIGSGGRRACRSWRSRG